eukprot:9422310-Lingulodinium_polyedra.AAC.1
MRSRGSAAHRRASARRMRAVAVAASRPSARPITVLNLGRAEATFSHIACASMSGRSCEAALAMAGMA